MTSSFSSHLRALGFPYDMIDSPLPFILHPPLQKCIPQLPCEFSPHTFPTSKRFISFSFSHTSNSSSHSFMGPSSFQLCMDYPDYSQDKVASMVDMIGCSPSSYMGDRRPKPQPEQALKCPRCSSTNTKFCYYNNYSLSQPRYFCKTCRRYWTQGGALRNVPVGGGCRKNKKSATPTKKPSENAPQVPDGSGGFGASESGMMMGLGMGNLGFQGGDYSPSYHHHGGGGEMFGYGGNPVLPPYMAADHEKQGGGETQNFASLLLSMEPRPSSCGNNQPVTPYGSDLLWRLQGRAPTQQQYGEDQKTTEHLLPGFGLNDGGCSSSSEHREMKGPAWGQQQEHLFKSPWPFMSPGGHHHPSSSSVSSLM